MPYYQRRFDEVLDLLDGYSPQVEPEELGAAFLSLDGLADDPQTYAEGIIASLHRRFGFMPSVGIAEGKFPARVAATITRFGLAKVVPLDEAAAFLAPLPVDHLPAGESMLWRAVKETWTNPGGVKEHSEPATGPP